jgi:imidazoleglycerol-phosphate dehydratase / histidinol-phosphatase
MKRVLFIDRDGTLIREPETDFQVDSLEKLEFMPDVFKAMHSIATILDYELVMVSNQDGLGTSSFPEKTFWPAQNKMLKAFENEGVKFSEIYIDPTLPEENAPTRKPGIAMLGKYTSGAYDLKNSFVIGDRLTDVKLAANLGAKAVLYSKNDLSSAIKKNNLENVLAFQTAEWLQVYAFLRAGERKASVERNTKETKILVELDLDGSGKSEISSGLGFFDHMLDQIAKHASIDLAIKVDGDLQVDEHHTIEDTALALGEAIKKALGDKRGI